MTISTIDYPQPFRLLKDRVPLQLSFICQRPIDNGLAQGTPTIILNLNNQQQFILSLTRILSSHKNKQRLNHQQSTHVTNSVWPETTKHQGAIRKLGESYKVSTWYQRLWFAGENYSISCKLPPTRQPSASPKECLLHENVNEILVNWNLPLNTPFFAALWSCWSVGNDWGR